MVRASLLFTRTAKGEGKWLAAASQPSSLQNYPTFIVLYFISAFIAAEGHSLFPFLTAACGGVAATEERRRSARAQGGKEGNAPPRRPQEPAWHWERRAPPSYVIYYFQI